MSAAGGPQPGGGLQMARTAVGIRDARGMVNGHTRTVGVALALGIAAAASGCGGSSHGRDTAAANRTVQATTAEARKVELPEIFEAGGVVRARTTAAVTSRILAPVLEVRASAGDRVRAGQVLARLDDRDLSAQRRQAIAGQTVAEQGRRAAQAERDAAQASLALAQATHKRIAVLHARKSATDNELDQAVAALRAAEARAAGAEAQVAQSAAGLGAAGAVAEAASVGASWATIAAPFDGVVTEKLVEAGNMASPGMPLFRVEQTGALRLEVRVDESRAASIQPDQHVEVVFDGQVTRAGDEAASSADAGVVTGRVSEIARATEAGAHAFLVKIELPADVRTPSGTYARARFAGRPRTVVAVPANAVVRRGQLTLVFVAEADRARMRLVSVGMAAAPASGGTPLVEVLAGLDHGERVLVSPSAQIVDGVKIAGAGR